MRELSRRLQEIVSLTSTEVQMQRGKISIDKLKLGLISEEGGEEDRHQEAWALILNIHSSNKQLTSIYYVSGRQYTHTHTHTHTQYFR